MTLQELAGILQHFTNEHYGQKDFQSFFQVMHRLALKGMGVGIGSDPVLSGETAAMGRIRDLLQRQCAGEPWTIVDVGANVGQFLTQALGVFGVDHRRYFSFEPAPDAFAELQKNFGGRPGITLINAGLGEVEEQRPFFSNAPLSEIGSVYPRRLDHLGIAIRPAGTITLHTLDQFAAAQAIDRIHFLKLDVEGHELKCLQGARALLDARRVNVIQFEMGGTDIDSRTFLQDFWYALPQYQIARILRDGLQPIPKYDEADEVFLPQNLLAILKD